MLEVTAVARAAPVARLPTALHRARTPQPHRDCRALGRRNRPARLTLAPLRRRMEGGDLEEAEEVRGQRADSSVVQARRVRLRLEMRHR